MQKHILVVSQYFYPEYFRINDICTELINRGYKITVLTGIPNYPAGKFYKGYGWFQKRKEVWNGMEIIRLPIISRGHSPLRLVLNYYSFVISGFFWTICTNLKADYVFTFEVSPLIQAWVGVWFSYRRKVPNYLYVQDLWPSNLEVVGGIHNTTILNYYGKMATKIYKRCDVIFATSPSFVKEIQKRRPGNRDQVVYWPQYAEGIYKRVIGKRIPKIQNSKEKYLKIIFTGNIGYAQGLDILPKIAKRVEDIVFVIVGNGRYKKQFIEEIRDVNEKFVFVDMQPAEKIPELLCACDVAFISFMDNPLFEKTIPAKLQSYMACGMPILASASGETQRIIEEAKCGICCKIGSVEEVVDAISVLKGYDHQKLQKLGDNSIRYVKKHFDKDTLLDFFEKYIRK